MEINNQSFEVCPNCGYENNVIESALGICRNCGYENNEPIPNEIKESELWKQ